MRHNQNNLLQTRNPDFKFPGSRVLPIVVALLVLTHRVFGVVPPPEKLLPDDTLVVVTAPDFAKVRDLQKSLPQLQFWDDPAMKPFREHLASKWAAEFVQPLE